MLQWCVIFSIKLCGVDISYRGQKKLKKLCFTYLFMGLAWVRVTARANCPKKGTGLLTSNFRALQESCRKHFQSGRFLYLIKQQKTVSWTSKRFILRRIGKYRTVFTIYITKENDVNGNHLWFTTYGWIVFPIIQSSSTFYVVTRSMPFTTKKNSIMCRSQWPKLLVLMSIFSDRIMWLNVSLSARYDILHDVSNEIKWWMRIWNLTVKDARLRASCVALENPLLCLYSILLHMALKQHLQQKKTIQL